MEEAAAHEAPGPGSRTGPGGASPRSTPTSWVTSPSSAPPGGSPSGPRPSTAGSVRRSAPAGSPRPARPSSRRSRPRTGCGGCAGGSGIWSGAGSPDGATRCRMSASRRWRRWTGTPGRSFPRSRCPCCWCAGTTTSPSPRTWSRRPPCPPDQALVGLWPRTVSLGRLSTQGCRCRFEARQPQVEVVGSLVARRTRSPMLRWVSSTSSAPAAPTIAAIVRRRG